MGADAAGAGAGEADVWANPGAASKEVAIARQTDEVSRYLVMRLHRSSVVGARCIAAFRW
jgi:hypothetical protein